MSMGSKSLDYIIKTVLEYPNLHSKQPYDFGQAKANIHLLPHKGLEPSKEDR